MGLKGGGCTGRGRRATELIERGICQWKNGSLNHVMRLPAHLAHQSITVVDDIRHMKLSPVSNISAPDPPIESVHLRQS